MTVAKKMRELQKARVEAHRNNLKLKRANYEKPLNDNFNWIVKKVGTQVATSSKNYIKIMTPIDDDFRELLIDRLEAEEFNVNCKDEILVISW